MSEPHDIEEEEHIVFNPSNWIKRGKTYDPRVLPLHVVNAALALLEPPREAVEKLPSNLLPIIDFIKLRLPIQSHSLNTYKPEAWFTNVVPTVSKEDAVELVWKRPIPSVETLEMLEKNFGQMWFDGVKGIVDPRYHDGNEALPFWVLTLWKSVSEMLLRQDEWKEAYETLSTVVQDPLVSEHFPTIISILGRRSWNRNVEIGRFTFEGYKFNKLLRPRMLCDDITQCMNQALQTRLDRDRARKNTHYIAASRFATVPQTAAKKKFVATDLPQSLEDLEKRVMDNPGLKVWFPTLLNKHEVAICIDFEAHTIAYAHGTQEDFVSCIPAAMNTIAHGVFGDPLWAPNTRYLDRIRWFLALVPNPDNTSSDVPKSSLPSKESHFRIAIDSLLNPAEETAWKDIIDAGYDELASEIEGLDAKGEQDAVSDVVALKADVDSPVKRLKEGVQAAWKSTFSKPAKAETSKKRTAKSSDGGKSKKAKVDTQSHEEPASGPSGISKAAKSERLARERADKGIFDPKKREKWKTRIKDIDPRAEFFEDDLRAVRCSHCTRQIRTRTGTDTREFRNHWERCHEGSYDKMKTRVATANTSTLTSEFWRTKWNQRQEHQWKNDHQFLRIFSSKCEHYARPVPSHTTRQYDYLPCYECMDPPVVPSPTG
ncbi:hypothetical protein VNI00_016658 [Paramarasmius palmivorus]|uniref:Uncharacterized protein n=1 Tax=Paramarasmius palmivorus TaxID=297713 RepID=A0AAW0BCZ4_9AGAR